MLALKLYGYILCFNERVFSSLGMGKRKLHFHVAA